MSIAMLDKETLQKLFYFFLRKTGNWHDAEELASDTALEVICMIDRGYEPKAFYAWFWTVARKKYARWAENKRIYMSENEVKDISEFENASDGIRTDDIIVNKEQANLLYRELALLTGEYRKIIVAYYIEGKKICEISQTTGLPEGTVKRKLYESRKNLKEGMQMARKNGQRAYAPENITFGYGVNKHNNDGRPWNLAQRLISKNILLEAYNNPSTVEELSLALGVAAPYIEDELSVLTDSSIMKKLDKGKYETDFIIVDREKQLKWYELDMSTGREFSQEVFKGVESNLENIRRINFINSDVPSKYLYWSIFYLVIEKMSRMLTDEKGIISDSTKRPNDSAWEIIGYETTKFPDDYDPSSFVNRVVDEKGEFVFQKVAVPGIREVREFSLEGDHLWLLTDIIRNKKSLTELSLLEQQTVNFLSRQGVVKITENKIDVGFPVYNESKKGEFTKLHNVLKDIYSGEVYNIFRNIYDELVEDLMKTVPARLINQVKSVALTTLCCLKTTLVRNALEDGLISIPEKEDKSAVTMYMII